MDGGVVKDLSNTFDYPKENFLECKKLIEIEVAR